MPELSPEILRLIIESVVIAAVALGLFFGLKGRILELAQWAKLPRLAMAPVRLTLRYVILVCAALLILSLWGFQVDGIITAIAGILGLVAIGFVAVWSVLSNFLCTVGLIIFKPFYVGDQLELPASNVKGRVVDMSVVYTTLESAPGETVLVPNNTFFQTVIKRRSGAMTTDLATQLGRPSEETRKAPAA